MEKREIFLTLIALTLISFASAGITISEPLDTYSLGDRLYVHLNGIRGSEFGNLNIDLVCSNNSVRLAQLPSRAFDTNEDQSWSIPYKVLDKTDLEITDLNQIVGTCQVTATMGSQSATTKRFTISNSIKVDAKLERNNYNPGEPIRLFVDAVKSNGNPLNGFIQVTNATQFSKAVENGKSTEVFSMPKTIEAGRYLITIKAYDMSNQDLLNEGTTTVYFEINAVPTSLVLSLSSEEIMPGKDFKINADVYDQSGIKMEGKVSIKMISPKFEETMSSIDAGGFSEFKLEENATAGVWRLIANFDGLFSEREISVLENQKASFELEESLLIVTNVGNVPYTKPITLKIGEEEITLDLNIKLSETRKFNLQAPPGEYDVSISDGENTISNSVMLTGKAISVKDINKSVFKDYAIVWIFILIIIAITGFVLVKRFKKTKTIDGKESKLSNFFSKLKSKLFKKKEDKYKPEKLQDPNKKSQEFDPKKYSSNDTKVLDMTRRTGLQKAESSLVLKGEKNSSAVIALKIKNLSNLSENSKSELVKIINLSNTKKGLMDWKGEYAFIIFSPIVTRTYSNETLACKTSIKIVEELNNYNKKFKEKIEFNIGIHLGELIASQENSKLKYTSIGNTISFAKRLADYSSSKALVSEEVHRKMLRNLKISKIGEIGEKPVYEILELRNKEANEAKLKELLKRM